MFVVAPMAPPMETDQPRPAHPPAAARERLGLGAVTLLLAGLAAATPLRSGETPLRLVGTLLVLAGVLEILPARGRWARPAGGPVEIVLTPPGATPASR